MEDFSNLYSYDFEDYAVNHLKSLGYLVNQSIIVTCMGTGTEYDRSAQLDSVVYDLRYNIIYVVEIKSWDARYWVSADVKDTDWSYKTSPNGVITHKFNPIMQCLSHRELLQFVLNGRLGGGYIVNSRVLFKYDVPIKGYCLSLANGIILGGGFQSSRNVLDVYNLLKPYEDKSEKTRQEYRQYLEDMRYNRTGIYGRAWPNIENMLY